jgi:methyl-accepting chemotaxis protein
LKSRFTGSALALVDTAAQTMHEIVTSVTRVNDIMGEIASASDNSVALSRPQAVSRWIR